MGVIRTGKGWAEQIDGIVNGDMDQFLKGVKDEAIGITGSVIKFFFGGPDIETADD